jgi:hypothetical protein
VESDFPPVRGWRWWVAAVVLTVMIAVVAYIGLSRRIDRRVATGQPVSATVTVVTRLPLGWQVQSRRFTVTYDFQGSRSARVNNAFAEGNLHVGDRVTLYVDPAHPDRVALPGGQASEGLILLLPPFLVVAGVAWLIGLAGERVRWWRRFGRHRPAEAASLVELVTAYESDESLQWKSAQRALNAAVDAAAAGHTGPLNLLVYLRIGARGGPRVAWYWRIGRDFPRAGSRRAAPHAPAGGRAAVRGRPHRDGHAG